LSALRRDRLATFRVAARPTLDLSDPVIWGKENLPALFKGAALPILMTHTGVKVDRALLPLLPDGTLFAGAHDHLRFVHREGRTVYFHSGSWTEFVSIARLRKSATGLNWEVEQLRIAADDPVDEKLAALIREIMAKQLTAEETAVVGRTARALGPTDAAIFVVEAARQATGTDRRGDRRDDLWRGSADGRRVAFRARCLRAIRRHAVRRRADRRATLENPGASESRARCAVRRARRRKPDRDRARRDRSRKTLRLVTTDWGAKNAKAYFGDAAPAFVERPELKLKAAVIGALATCEMIK